MKPHLFPGERNMAIGTSFKQQCPSCEAMVSVKDAGMVGKKVECPKCKDKFIIQPPPKKKAEEDEDEVDAPKTKPTAKTAPAKPTPSAMLTKAKSSPKKPAEDADDEDEEKGKKPAAKTNTKARKEEDEGDEEDGKKKKKKAGINRFTMGIALGVVGLAVLAAAFYFIFLNKGSTSSKSSGPLVKKTGPSSSKGQSADVGSNDTEKEAKDEAKDKTDVRKAIEIPVSSSFGELTNLLPKETDHVAKISVKALFRQPIMLQEDLFHTPDGLKESLLKEKLGFSLQAIDHLLRADHYGAGGWSLTILHFQTSVEQEAVKKALGLKPAPDVNKHKHYQVTTVNPWFEQLASLAIGVPRNLRGISKDDKRTLFVHFHDSQTILCADEAPMVALLKADKRLKSFSGGEIPTHIPTGSADSSHTPMQDPWATIKPALKTLIERMEPVTANAKDMTFFCSATDMEAAQIPTPPQGAKVKSLWYPRQIWDVTLLLQDRNPRMRTLGVALLASAGGTMELRNEILCPLDNDARSLETELAMDVAPTVSHFLERILALKVAIPKKEELPGNPPTAPLDPTKAKAEPPSKITVKHKDKSVEFVLDLKFSSAELRKLHGIAALMACGLNAEMEALAGMFTRHDLAKAVKSLSEKGLAERTVPPGQFPPGAFLHTGSPSQRFLREPMQRVSWMAGLLPFLGQETVYGKINFKDSWRSPSNWLPAATLIPQFVDPTYPPSSYYVAGLGLPLEPAATHYVGIAGVGLDAADYDPADSAIANKRGVMGYNNGLRLEDIAKGHGLGNTIVILQVPPDGLAGVTPWMAGGGSTLRGVPDQNSVEPFVFNDKDASGKTTRRGTYALMADGSVRFIDPGVSDDVFKALATATGPLPDGYNPDSPDSKTPKVLDTKRPVAKTPPTPKKK
jgi:Protein of unknown function (DUF1559)